MPDNQDTLPDFIEARGRAKFGQANINIELGITTAQTFASGSINLQTGGGSAVGGTGVLNALTGGTTPGGGACFLGETLFTLFNGLQVNFAELYEHKEDYKYALSFDDDNNPVSGDVLGIFKRTAYEYVRVTFQDESVTNVIGEHRYFVPEGKYIAIKNLLDKFVMGEKNDVIQVKSLETIVVSEGVDVYNATIKNYQNYCADRKRVHNLKPIPGGGGE